MKIFFDTNVYISESLGSKTAAAILEATQNAAWRIYCNTHVTDEVRSTLKQKLRKSTSLVKTTVDRIRRRTTRVKTPSSRHRVPGDEMDNPILRAALGAGAHYLVTGDKRLLALDPYEGLRIVSLAAYRQILIHQGFILSNS